MRMTRIKYNINLFQTDFILFTSQNIFILTIKEKVIQIGPPLKFNKIYHFGSLKHFKKYLKFNKYINATLIQSETYFK